MSNDSLPLYEEILPSPSSLHLNWTPTSVENSSTLTSPSPSSYPEEYDDGDYVPYNERIETYVVPAIFVFIFVVGVLGNGTLIAIFARHRRMRNVPNTYIFSLALGDLLLILTCVPFTSTLYTLESWPYGLVICKLSEFVKDLSVGVSVFTLTALSAERYCAIVNPMRRHLGGSLGSRTVTFCVAFGIWLIAIALATPAATFARLQEHALLNNHSVIVYCYSFPGEPGLGEFSDKIYVVMRFLVYYAIPLCAITVFYVLMAKHLEQSARQMPGEGAHSTSNQVQARKKVAKMVLAFVVIFVLCFLPHQVFTLWFHLNPNSMRDFDEFWHVLRIVGFCLSFSNSCINPIALYCVSGTFRKHFNRHLLCCCIDDEETLSTADRLRQDRSTMMDKSRVGGGGRGDPSSHTLVHFHSSVRRNQHEVTLTTNFSMDKT